MDIHPVVLDGNRVRLEPLTVGHHAALCEAGREWSLTPESVRSGIESALAQQAAGTTMPYAIVAKESNAVVGGTRFLNISPENRRLEIGSTWIARPWRRTAVNTEAKFLMLEHAFERIGCVRVEFRVEARNAESRAAVLRVGATEEGTLRCYRVVDEGVALDVVSYSVVEAEWAAVKSRLRDLMSRRYN